MGIDAKRDVLMALKDLLYKGFLSSEVNVDGVVFTVSTLSVSEQVAVMTETGILEIPKDILQTYSYLPVLLKKCIKKINGVVVDEAEIGPILRNATPDVLMTIAAAYFKLYVKEQEAQNEIKNISATPNPEFFGK